MKRNFCFCVLMSLILLGFSSTAVSQFGDPVPRYPQEMDGMVNMMDRSIYFSVTDLAVPGRGPGISFTRYYNSDGLTRRPQDPSQLGHAWSHSYQWELRKTVEDYTKNYRTTWSVITGSGSVQNFTQTTANSKTVYRPESGVRATLTSEDANVFIYTTKAGIRYKFEKRDGAASDARHVLTEIKDPNGNKLTLYYEDAPESRMENVAANYPRLVAVEDSIGRILKFYYVSTASYGYLRYINKIEFGIGTKTALTTVYQTIKYTYTRVFNSSQWRNYILLSSVAHQLGSGDPRGNEVKTQYKYYISDPYIRSSYFGYLSTIVSPLGNWIGFGFYGGKVSSVGVRDVPTGDSTYGDVIYVRIYDDSYIYGWRTEAYNMYPKDPSPIRANRRHYNEYYVGSRQYVTQIIRKHNRKYRYHGQLTWDTYSNWNWQYTNRHVTRASLAGGGSGRMYDYKISYAGSNAAHNSRLGNATKWEQLDPKNSTIVLRKWEADYETKYNRPIWQIDPMGHKTTFTYDTKGNLTEQRSKANTGTQPHAVGHDIVTTHAYDSYGNRTTTTFMPGTTQEKVVETVYDSTKHTYPIEVKTTVTVDGTAHTIKTKSEWDVNRGLKTADIDAQGRRTEYAYWQDRKLKYTLRVADGMYTVPTYDKNGNVTQTQVRKSNWQTGTLIAQTKTEYDGMNRAVKAHSFNDNWTTPYASTETIYDGFGDVSETKDPRNLKTTYTRDRMSRVTKQTLPDGDWVETRYNALSQVTKAWTSQNGTETSPAVSNTYDNLNRLSQVSYSTGESVSYTYDLGDNVLTQQTNDGANTYTYTFTHDQLNRIKNRTDSLLGYKTFYEYDDSSMRTRMYVNPTTGSTTTKLYDVQYTYDEANRLLTVKDVLADKTESYGYFDIGALKKVTVPNGITAHRTLDNVNRLSTLTYKKDASTTLSSLTYTYDDKSNVTQLVRDDTGAGGSSKTFTYGYDGLSRLTSANYGDETVSYTYDKSGNRLTQVSSVDGTTTYTVATNSNQLTYRSLVPEDTDFSTMNYTYDAEGKLTQRSEGTDSDAFTYGFGSQLKQIQKTRNNTVTQTLTYAYDGGGKRVKVTDSQGTRYFLYDGLMPVLELDSSKNITASYLYGANGVVYRRVYNTSGETTTYEYEYHHTNALGSNIIITDDSKNVDARYYYDAFGAVRSETDTTENVRKFTGKEYESDVKLYYYGARYYDPHIGRFTQRDPAGDGVNWYAYAGNNPLAFIDPTGMYIILPGGTEIRSVPELVDGSYVRPRGLTDEGGVVWDSIFTGGKNGTGIAGSESAGNIVKDIIESKRPVKIGFAKLPEHIGGTADSPLWEIEIEINDKNKNPGTDSEWAKLTMTIVHELSHAHDFMNHDWERITNPYGFLYSTELGAYDLEARYAREMDRVNGIYQFGTYSRHSGFTRNQLTNYGGVKYYTQLHALAYRSMYY